MIWIVIVILSLLLVLALLWLLALRAHRCGDAMNALRRYHYAHRGLHDKKVGVPENSLLAFRRAVETGYGAELDVHLSKDRQLIVMHDECLKRTTGDIRNIADLTLPELRALRLEHTQEQIPVLFEVLALFTGKTPLVIEIKPVGGNHAELTRLVCEELDRYPELSYCIESFDPRVLRWLRRNRPEILRGQLATNFVKSRNGLSLPLAFCLKNLLTGFLTVPDFIAYNFCYRSVRSLRLSRRVYGVAEFSWTIRSEANASAALQDGCAIIFEGFDASKLPPAF